MSFTLLGVLKAAEIILATGRYTSESLFVQPEEGQRLGHTIRVSIRRELAESSLFKTSDRATSTLLVIRANLVLSPDRSAPEKGSSWSSGIESGGATLVFPMLVPAA